MKTKWTYKVETIKPPVFAKSTTKAEFIADVLNRHGLEGWELISAPTLAPAAELQFYFKRPF